MMPCGFFLCCWLAAKAGLYFEQLSPELAWEAAVANAHGTAAGSSHDVHGYIAQWLERLTADQQVPGSNPGVPFSESQSSQIRHFEFFRKADQ